ncbi:hypothetical protein BJ508DRAFT_373419 [Ascobolus immersus RN42]|uniref:Uncharacterized protein n=1 Tax=Ascobolus immersus RN42 TaxID=1160509 RepID=A0A3N4II84_ASCIM|nr:hypothetical protein BJ508DRAFT_373419 [Ascobolus immersus RN42]
MPHAITPPATPPLESRKYFQQHGLNPTKRIRKTADSNFKSTIGTFKTAITPGDSPSFIKTPPTPPLSATTTQGHSDSDNWKQATGSHPASYHYDAFCGRMTRVVQTIRAPPIKPPPGFDSRIPPAMEKLGYNATLPERQFKSLASILDEHSADITYNTVDWSFGTSMRFQSENTRFFSI